MVKENMFLKRLGLLREKMLAEKCPAILITRPEDRRYLSGFKASDPQADESSGCLLITLNQQWLLTDFRYQLAAQAEAPDFELLIYRSNAAQNLAEILKKAKISKLFVDEEHLTLAMAGRLKKEYTALNLMALPAWVLELRAVKDAYELALIKKALKITEAALGKLWAAMKPGWTEQEAAVYLEREFVNLGASGPSFATIMASGPNGALPHADPGSRRLKESDLIVIDCGALYKGYAADITRTKIIGEPAPWQKEIYTIVREAQLAALKGLKPGLTGAQADKLAREVIEKAGYGKYFGHSLGHGVGLAVHERPSLSPLSGQILKPGMITTIEPGIYLPKRGGVRLEQMALITETGARVLNHDNNFYSWP